MNSPPLAYTVIVCHLNDDGFFSPVDCRVSLGRWVLPSGNFSTTIRQPVMVTSAFSSFVNKVHHGNCAVTRSAWKNGRESPNGPLIVTSWKANFPGVRYALMLPIVISRSRYFDAWLCAIVSSDFPPIEMRPRSTVKTVKMT